MRLTFAAGLAAGAMLASPPLLADTATICGQKVDYLLEPLAPATPQDLRAFSGVWIGEAGSKIEVYDGTFCIGFIVTSVKADGSVAAKYVWGDKLKLFVGSTIDIKPGVVDWPGVISGGALRLDTPDGAYSYELRSVGTNELKGRRVGPDGKSDVQLKRK